MFGTVSNHILVKAASYMNYIFCDKNPQSCIGYKLIYNISFGIARKCILSYLKYVYPHIQNLIHIRGHGTRTTCSGSGAWRSGGGGRQENRSFTVALVVTAKVYALSCLTSCTCAKLARARASPFVMGPAWGFDVCTRLPFSILTI